jgi:hypothetical protein
MLMQLRSHLQMLYTLGEWLADIIDRLFQLLEHVPPMKKGNPFKGHVQGLLRRFFDVLFHQMSPTLYAASLERVVRKALQSLYPPAKQLVGYMLDSAGLVLTVQHASRTLSLVLKSRSLAISLG